MISPYEIQTPPPCGEETLLLSLATYIYEKIEKEKREEVFSLPEELKKRKGMWGLTANLGKKVYIVKTKEILLIPDFYLEDIPLTREETLYKAMEKELRETFGKKRITGYVMNEGTISPPVMAKVWRGHGVKVDIKACYYTIYSNFGLDASVIYEKKDKTIIVKALGLGIVNRQNSLIIARLEGDKLLRNTLYGFTRARRKAFVRWVEGWEVKTAEGSGGLYNPNIYEIACILTNAILQEMRRRGVRVQYWNVDGGIVEAEDKEKAMEVITDFGFTPKIEAEGETDIRGVGSYRVGQKITKPYLYGYGGGDYENTYEIEGLDPAKVRKVLTQGGIKP